MPLISDHLPGTVEHAATSNAIPDVLDRNWQTTAAIGLGVATGGVTGALMLSAFPAQTLAAGSLIGGLAVAGNRRANGKDPAFGLLARFEKSEESAEVAEAPQAA
jgi:hypothetical protein